MSDSERTFLDVAIMEVLPELQSDCSDDVKVEDKRYVSGRLGATPTIIVRGQSCYPLRRYMLSLDWNLISTNISSFISALCLMFGSYYNFNIHYPSELPLEFLQRCFFSTNPEKGTKVENKAPSQREPSSPHPDSGSRRPRVVLSLNINSLCGLVFFAMLKPQCVL